MFNVEMDLNPDETILHEGGANHFVGIEAVGGKLFLTNRRLYYKSHGMNMRNHELNLLFSEIRKVAFCRTMFIVPNGLKIHLADGNVEQFVVQGRKKWKEMIEGKL